MLGSGTARQGLIHYCLLCHGPRVRMFHSLGTRIPEQDAVESSGFRNGMDMGSMNCILRSSPEAVLLTILFRVASRTIAKRRLGILEHWEITNI